MKPLRVAVTGVAGASGQSIMKALFATQVRDRDGTPVPIEVYPVDVQPFSAGLYRGRCGGTVLPRPEEDIDAWERWLIENRIDVLLPGADRDLLPLAQVRDQWLWTKVIVGKKSFVETANDKFTTHLLLTLAGIPTPVSEDLEAGQWFEDRWERFRSVVDYPVIVKPRSDAASRGVYICRNESEVLFYARQIDRPVVQEYLDGPEFTCGLVRDLDGHTAICMMRRHLYAGSTYRAEVGWWSELEPVLRAISDELQPYGPLNVQLRLTKDGPKVFELNARMSGSSAIRAHFGFNEPEMLLSHFVYGRPVRQPDYRHGYAFRYWDEVYLEGATEAEIGQYAGRVPVKGKIPSWL